MTTITKTITGDTPAHVVLASVSRRDTGLAANTTPSLPANFTAEGGGVYSITFTDAAGDCAQGYFYTYQLDWPDGSLDGPFTDLTPPTGGGSAGPAIAAGPVPAAVAGLQTLLANLPYFQTWTGTSTSTEALENIFLGEVGYAISSLSIAAGVLAINTREPHTIPAGQSITLQGASTGAQSAVNVDGVYTVLSVTANGLTVATDAADLATTYPRGVFVLPSGEPFACISEDEGALNCLVIGTGGACVFNGALEILFENAIPAGYANDPVNALTQARSELSQLVQDIAQTQGTADFICLNTVDVSASPQFVPTAEQADNTVRFERWQALVKVTWGLAG